MNAIIIYALPCLVKMMGKAYEDTINAEHVSHKHNSNPLIKYYTIHL